MAMNNYKIAVIAGDGTGPELAVGVRYPAFVDTIMGDASGAAATADFRVNLVHKAGAKDRVVTRTVE